MVCGFAGVAVLCVMLGLSFEPALATRAGGIMGLGIASILSGYGFFATTRPYRRTETWLILPREQRPPAEIAQQVIGSKLRDAYLWFAHKSALVSAVLLATSLVLSLAGIAPAELG